MKAEKRECPNCRKKELVKVGKDEAVCLKCGAEIDLSSGGPAEPGLEDRIAEKVVEKLRAERKQRREKKPEAKNPQKPENEGDEFSW